MKEDRIRAVRFSLFILLIGFYLSLLVKGDFVGYYYYDNGEISLTIIGFNRYVLAVIAIYTIFTFVSNTINIYNKSTDNLKKYARINLIGTLLFSVVPLFLYIFEIYQYLPGMDILFPAIGLLIVSIAIYKSPQILYLLSFELYHISVIQGNTGLILYHYSWETEFHMNYMKQQMYSSMLSALASFSDNTMNAGRFTSLSLEKGVLIIRYRPEFNYYFALFVNKETKMMMNSLSKFEDQFIMRYGFQLMNNENYIISLTEEDDLIHEIFNFINNKKT